jgi:hypothetical protein
MFIASLFVPGRPFQPSQIFVGRKEERKKGRKEERKKGRKEERKKGFIKLTPGPQTLG